MAEEYLTAEVQYNQNNQIATDMRYDGPNIAERAREKIGTPIPTIGIEKGRGDYVLPVEPRRPIEAIIAPTFPGRPNPGIGGGMGLVLSLSDIEAIIPKLQSVSSELRTLWKNTLSGSVAKIENSWAGGDAKVYIDKVQALDPQVNNMCEAIDLLAKTYQKVLDRSRATMTDVYQKIAYSVK